MEKWRRSNNVSEAFDRHTILIGRVISTSITHKQRSLPENQRRMKT